MVGVREHVYRLNGLHFIFRIEQLQVARLRSRLQLTYTMRLGSANRMTSTTSWCIPAREGR